MPQMPNLVVPKLRKWLGAGNISVEFRGAVFNLSRRTSGWWRFRGYIDHTGGPPNKNPLSIIFRLQVPSPRECLQVGPSSVGGINWGEGLPLLWAWNAKSQEIFSCLLWGVVLNSRWSCCTGLDSNVCKLFPPEATTVS